MCGCHRNFQAISLIRRIPSAMQCSAGADGCRRGGQITSSGYRAGTTECTQSAAMTHAVLHGLHECGPQFQMYFATDLAPRRHQELLGRGSDLTRPAAPSNAGRCRAWREHATRKRCLASELNTRSPQMHASLPSLRLCPSLARRHHTLAACFAPMIGSQRQRSRTPRADNLQLGNTSASPGVQHVCCSILGVAPGLQWWCSILLTVRWLPTHLPPPGAEAPNAVALKCRRLHTRSRLGDLGSRPPAIPRCPVQRFQSIIVAAPARGKRVQDDQPSAAVASSSTDRHSSSFFLFHLFFFLFLFFFSFSLFLCF